MNIKGLVVKAGKTLGKAAVMGLGALGAGLVVELVFGEKETNEEFETEVSEETQEETQEA